MKLGRVGRGRKQRSCIGYACPNNSFYSGGSGLGRDGRRAVCPKVLAGVRWERARRLEVEVPLAAAAEAVEGGDGDGVGAVPAATAPFETVDREFALGFGGAAADLPTLAAELGIENHLPTLRDVVQQLIGGLALFRRARKPSSPLHQVFPGGIISVVLERMQNLAHPSFTFPRVCS